MVVSMMQLIVELPETVLTLKEKRRVIVSLKQKIHTKFRISFAEVDLQDSCRFAHFGASIASNSRSFGEAVLQKALAFVDSQAELRICESSIHSEHY